MIGNGQGALAGSSKMRFVRRDLGQVPTALPPGSEPID
jgi:hypothetical protein